MRWPARCPQADSASLIFEAKRLEGFWLNAWLRSRTLLGQLRLARQIQELLRSDLKTEFQSKIALQEADHVPAEWRKRILHARLVLDGTVLMGSDAPPSG